nr:hypothetical protein [Luteimonas salinisoli]
MLILAASHLEIELLPELYEQCRSIGRVPRLDVLLQGRGGVVNDVRRIARLLRRFTDHLAFIVPFRCESSATLLALSADEIIAGDLAIFSPIDPHLHGSADGAGPAVFSCQDIRLFGEMCSDWFGVSSDEARIQSLGLLCNSIFPPTLTAFYRTTLEMLQIGEELLRFQLPDASEAARSKIIKQLMFGYHSHSYALAREDLAEIGLKLRSLPDVEDSAWEISKCLQARIGGGVRESEGDDWFDAVIGSRSGMKLRKRRPNGLAPSWVEVEIS